MNVSRAKIGKRVPLSPRPTWLRN